MAKGMKDMIKQAQRMQRDMMKVQGNWAASSLWARLQRSCDHHHERPTWRSPISPSNPRRSIPRIWECSRTLSWPPSTTQRKRRRQRRRTSCRVSPAASDTGPFLDGFPARSVQAACRGACAPSRDREKSAQRLAFHIMRQTPEESGMLCQGHFRGKGPRSGPARCAAATRLRSNARSAPCPAGTGSSSVLSKRLLTYLPLERAGYYKGVYHVLGGAISPLMGSPRTPCHQAASRTHRRPRIRGHPLHGTTLKGPYSVYLTRVLKEKGVRSRRMARGLPAAAHQYIDEVTLYRALEAAQNSSSP